ncbi:FAD-dependent oxidoreductase [Ruminococcaceae bacterium OttesenSCG-928-L11]|nr:FAD-dependent oxidoreductase [Ruminococcaceae bacterium OttesenSCG-928-L11]
MIQQASISGFRKVEHKVDFCVVGGGIAGMCAAIAAARNGSKTVLIQDRPVLGGNASSEVRMWIRGSHGENNRETGLLEEFALENIYRNPTLNFSIWDSVLYEKVRFEPNIDLILNCSVCEAEMDGNHIIAVSGWQTTTQTWHYVTADIFADCSGDSVLAPLTGAEFRMGREGRDEFGEDIAPAESDNRTMGMSCLIQARETPGKSIYTPPVWANRYDKDSLPFRLIPERDRKNWHDTNFWWMELGGMQDSIHDTEELRDQLLKVAFGVWDFIKNSGCFEADNWELDWVGFLPGKRESRRYVGAHIVTQHDVRTGGHFDDLIAYGGWKMDDHHPAGIETSEQPTIFHPAPAPFGLPYRCIYSKNIDNLLFAGRNISTTHSALSSTRVMATCGTLGQAAGTAAWLCKKYRTLPRDIYSSHIRELQTILMDDDCYLPFHKREASSLMKAATIHAPGSNPEILLDGMERNEAEHCHFWSGKPGDTIKISFEQLTQSKTLRIVFDSDLNRECYSGHDSKIRTYPMACNIDAGFMPVSVPGTIVRQFDVTLHGEDGTCDTIRVDNNYQRLWKMEIPAGISVVDIALKGTWGSKSVQVYSVDIY